MTGLAGRLRGIAPFQPEEGGGGSFAPRTVDELVAVARSLKLEAEPVGLRGRGRGPWWARRDPAPALTIRTLGLAGEPEISPLDLVMTAEAGLGVAEARAAARNSGLDLLLEDPPSGPCSIGGLLSRGEGRGSQLGPAGPRAAVLGIDAVLPDGRLVRCGGRVVKNVAGYDTHRLFIGSLGTLGAIARVHMKLVPRPGVEQWFALSMSLDAAIDRAEAILRSAPQAGSLSVDCVLGSEAAAARGSAELQGPSAVVRVRLCGSRRRVEILRDLLAAELAGCRDATASDSVAETEPATLLRIAIPAKEIHGLLGRWDSLLRAGSVAARARVEPGAGVLWLRLDRKAGSSLCEALAQAARPSGKLLFAWRAAGLGGPTWDPAPTMLPFWLGMRARLDPQELWNPGILPAGPRP